jgi:hypothetical protein
LFSGDFREPRLLVSPALGLGRGLRVGRVSRGTLLFSGDLREPRLLVSPALGIGGDLQLVSRIFWNRDAEDVARRRDGRSHRAARANHDPRDRRGVRAVARGLESRNRPSRHSEVLGNGPELRFGDVDDEARRIGHRERAEARSPRSDDLHRRSLHLEAGDDVEIDELLRRAECGKQDEQHGPRGLL